MTWMEIYRVPEFGEVQGGVANARGELRASREVSERTLSITRGLGSVQGVFENSTPRLDLEGIEDLLGRIHAPAYLGGLRAGPHPNQPEITPFAHAHAAPGVPQNTTLDRRSYERALASAATSRAAARGLVAGRTQVTYAVCRPPGHHAGRAFLGGYCLINNAAVAALELLSSGYRRPVVLDLDFHPGNGTSDVLADHPGIGFASLHARTDVNFPWVANLKPKYPDHVYIEFESPPSIPHYLQKLSDLLVSVWAEGADALVLSLGYDIIEGDPHGGWALPPVIFQEIGALIASIGLPICVVQEGGYHLDLLEECARQFATGISSERQYNKRNSA